MFGLTRSNAAKGEKSDLEQLDSRFQNKVRAYASVNLEMLEQKLAPSTESGATQSACLNEIFSEMINEQHPFALSKW